MLETRSLLGSFDTQVDGDKPIKVGGYFVLWDEPTTLTDGKSGRQVRELVRRGALTPTLERRDTVKAYVRHQHATPPVARSDKGTLEVREDAKGAYILMTLPNTTEARDVVANIKHGNIDGLSWGADPRVTGRKIVDRWRKDAAGLMTREILELPIFEVSLTGDAAYKNTTVELRESMPNIELIEWQLAADDFLNGLD